MRYCLCLGNILALPLALLFLLMSPLAALCEEEEAITTIQLPPPISAGISADDLVLTDDISVAEAQAKAYPNNPEAHFLLAIAYTRTPYLEKAYHAFRRAKKLMKHSEGGYKNLDQKIQEYEAMTLYRADDPLVLYRLAFGYFTKGYGIQEDYIQNTDEQPEIYYQKAEETLRRLIAVHPDDIWARNYLGFLLINMNEDQHLSEAIRLWEESITVDPKNPGAYILLGEAYLKQGNLKKAVEYGAKGLESRLIWELP